MLEKELVGDRSTKSVNENERSVYEYQISPYFSRQGFRTRGLYLRRRGKM